MSVRDLIVASKAKTDRTFPPEVLADLKEVLKSNDRETNFKARVTAGEFMAYAEKLYKFRVSRETFDRWVRRQLGRGWAK